MLFVLFYYNLKIRFFSSCINLVAEVIDLGSSEPGRNHSIKNADHIVDFGPYAGKNGGEIVAEGSLEDIKKNNLLDHDTVRIVAEKIINS